MENQTNQEKQYTQAEVIANLKEAIELQTLQTQLQELRTKMVMSRANEIHAIIQINSMQAPEGEEMEEEETPTQEQPKERKLKVTETK